MHEGPEEEAHHQGQEEDGEAPVAGEAVGRLHDPEEAQGELAPEVGAEEAGEGEEAFHVEADELVLAAVDPEDFSRPKPHLPLAPHEPALQGALPEGHQGVARLGPGLPGEVDEAPLPARGGLGGAFQQRLGVSLGGELKDEGKVRRHLRGVPLLGDAVGEGPLLPPEAGEEVAVLHGELRLQGTEAHGGEDGAVRRQVGGAGVVAEGRALVGLHVPAHHLARLVKGQAHEVGDGDLCRGPVPVDVRVLEPHLQGEGGEEEEEGRKEPLHSAPPRTFPGGKRTGTGSSPPGFQGWQRRTRRTAR